MLPGNVYRVFSDEADARAMLSVSGDLYTASGKYLCQPGETFLLECAAICVVSTSPKYVNLGSWNSTVA